MKNTNYIRHAPYLRNSIAYDYDFWYNCVKWLYLQVFFHFFKILIFRVVSGVKEQKLTQNDKKSWLWRSISQEPYIMWFSFMVHMCNMIISPGVFFENFDFPVCYVCKRAKTSRITYLKNHTSYDLHLWYTCVKW